MQAIVSISMQVFNYSEYGVNKRSTVFQVKVKKVAACVIVALMLLVAAVLVLVMQLNPPNLFGRIKITTTVRLQVH